MKALLRRSLPPIALGLVAACSDANAPTPALSLSFATQAPASASARRGPLFSVMSDTFASGANTLIITKAQLVLERIKLERKDVTACDSTATTDGCEEFKAGPVLLDLPLTPGAVPQATINLSPGTYTKVDFKIHKVEDHDTAFVTANPTFANKSIRVEGTFNGTAFTFETDLDVEQELEFATPLVIADTTTSTNLTVRVDLSTWFASGTALVDPSTANKGGANEGVVKENIKKSFKAFRDHEKDGGNDDDNNH